MFLIDSILTASVIILIAEANDKLTTYFKSRRETNA